MGMKRFALATACLPAMAVAQTFPKPSDVPLFTQVVPTYNTSAGVNTTIDPAVTPAPYAGLTNIPVPSTTGRVAANTGDNGNYCPVQGLGGPSNCQEAKFRTHAGFSHMAPDDPIRNYGQPGTSHLHCFFGAGSTNAYSTYKSLRKHSLNSTAVGTDANGTAYWFPCFEVLNPYADGKSFALKANFHVIYYTKDATTAAAVTAAQLQTLLVPGIRYVLGFDMDASSPTTQYAWLQTYIDTANTAIGHTRYTLKNSNGLYPTQVYYVCTGAVPTTTFLGGGANSTQYIVDADGSDPFGGTCDHANFTGSQSATTLTVSAMSSGSIRIGGELYNGTTDVGTINAQLTGTANGVGTYTISNSATISSTSLEAKQEFYPEIAGPDCWDGNNPWSPGGYKHLIPRVWDADNSVWACPNNYYSVPSLVLQFRYTQYGWTDRQRWVLSSDLAYRTAHSLTSASVPSGMTFHTDWMHGWDQAIMLKWQENCNGALHTTPHQCNSSQISSTEALVGTPPGGAGISRNPQVPTTALPHSLETDSGWMLIPPAWSGGMVNMKVHN